jgi:hypothetical protein
MFPTILKKQLEHNHVDDEGIWCGIMSKMNFKSRVCYYAEFQFSLHFLMKEFTLRENL